MAFYTPLNRTMLEHIGCFLLRVHVCVCGRVRRYLLGVFVCLIDRSTAESQEPQSSFGPLEFL